jgi:hypothetical protein
MKKKNFTESKVLSIIKEYEGRRAIDDLCRENDISWATVYNRKKKYSDMEGGLVKQLNELRDDSKWLNYIYAEL